MTPAESARAIKAAFAAYRGSMEVARDPDERPRERDAAWTRAANAWARIERHLTLIELRGDR